MAQIESGDKMDSKSKFAETIENLIEVNKDKFKKNGKIPKGAMLSRRYIAKYILGVSGTWFSAIVNGEKEPSDEVVIKLAEFFEVDEDYMFFLLDRVHPEKLKKFKEMEMEKLKSRFKTS